MTFKQFIKVNRKELDEHITKAMNGFPAHPSCTTEKFNDNERREWVLNDEGLYRWARSEGVKI